MRQLVYFLLVILPLLSACQTTQNPKPIQHTQRIQGTLMQEAGLWYIQPCATQQPLLLSFANPAIENTFNSFYNSQGAPTFADLRAELNTHSLADADQATTTFWYRLQADGHACQDPDFHKLGLRVHGNEPFWSLLLSNDGLIFLQPDQPPIALPYIVEQLPDDFLYISSQADDEHLQLWLSPAQCTDSMSGTINHLSAMLDWNGHIFNGCGHYGAQRE